MHPIARGYILLRSTNTNTHTRTHTQTIGFPRITGGRTLDLLVKVDMDG